MGSPAGTVHRALHFRLLGIADYCLVFPKGGMQHAFRVGFAMIVWLASDPMLSGSPRNVGGASRIGAWELVGGFGIAVGGGATDTPRLEPVAA